MQPKPDGDNRDYLSTLLYGFIAIFEFFRVWRYIKAVANEEEAKEYEKIIDQKDKIIEKQQRELERYKKIIDDKKK